MFHRLQVVPQNFTQTRELIEDIFGRLPHSNGSISADIVERENSFEIKLNVPGFSKENISIDLEDNLLKVTATKSEESKNEGERYLMRERSTQTLSRSFNLPDNVDTNAIKANQEHGVLNIVVPKKAPQLPASQKISID